MTFLCVLCALCGKKSWSETRDSWIVVSRPSLVLSVFFSRVGKFCTVRHNRDWWSEIQSKDALVTTISSVSSVVKIGIRNSRFVSRCIKTIPGLVYILFQSRDVLHRETQSWLVIGNPEQVQTHAYTPKIFPSVQFSAFSGCKILTLIISQYSDTVYWS